MEALKPRAEKLYSMLVRSPRGIYAVLPWTAYAVLTALKPCTVLALAYAIAAAALMHLYGCMRMNKLRVAGILLYTLPLAIPALFSTHPLGVGSLALTSSLLYALLFATCSTRVAALYLAVTTTANILAYGFVKAAVALAASLAFTVIAVYSVGIDKLTVLRGSLRAWTDDSYDLLESFLDKLGEERNVRIDIVKLGNTVLVVPGVHYGPFRGLCSSSLPSQLRRIGNNIIPLHGCGSHELNTTSRSEAAKIVDAVAKALSSISGCTPVEPMIVTKDAWRAAVLGCVEKPIVVAWRKDGMEDVPCSLVPHDIVFVDAHNCEVERVETKGLQELLETIRRRLKPCKDVLCCGVVVDAPEAMEANACQPWIGVVKQCCKSRCVTLVVIPANNVEPNAAAMYASKLPHETVLVTIDDHSCSAVGERGAPPLSYSEKLLDKIMDAIRACKPQPCKLGYTEVIQRVRVWGDAMSAVIGSILERGLRAAVATLALYVALVVLASL